MGKNKSRCCGALIFSLFAFSATAQATESVYTDLTLPHCKRLTADKQTGATTDKCLGVEGYSLVSLFDDERQSLTVVDPKGKEYPLNFWEVITHSFSDLGKKAEWRVIQKGSKKVPVALIVRVNARSDAGANTSYLAVSKITPETICVTDRIDPGPKANEEARQKADDAASRPCLSALK